MESTYTLNGAKKGMGTGGNAGSEIRFGGSEDLGNGLKANFNQAILNNHNSGSAIGQGYQAHVGLSGDFGSVQIGKMFSPLALATWGNDAMGGAAISSNLANAPSATVLPSNTITYTSPSIAGITLALQGDGETTKHSGYSLTYATGAFSASYASHTIGSGKPANGLGANYDFGMAKVFVSSLTQSGQTDISGIGISVPLGAATVVASSSSQSKKSAYELVAKYNLSKRTQVYFQNVVTDAGATAASVSTNAVGISHAF
jgi:predicted porin